MKDPDDPVFMTAPATSPSACHILFAVGPEPRKGLRWLRGMLVIVPAIALFLAALVRGEDHTAVAAAYFALWFGFVAWLPTSMGRGAASILVAAASVALLLWADRSDVSVPWELYLAPGVLFASGIVDMLEDWGPWKSRRTSAVP